METLKKWAVRVLPGKIIELWKELAARGKRPPYTPAEVMSFTHQKAGGREPFTYSNLLSCWEQLSAELKGGK